jgi:protein SCO1/2
MKVLARAFALLGCWLAAGGGAFAHATAEDLSRHAGFTQRLSQTIPSELAFRDETGRDVRLADYYGSTPIVLVFAWYGCSTLCPTVVGNLVRSLDRSGVAPDRVQVVVASIDPGDSPPAALRMKRVYLSDASRREDARAWHLLTGTDSAISALTQAAGFRYAYDAGSRQYAHPAGIVLMTPQGTISRYFLGFDFTPAQLRDAVDDAAARRVASPVDRLLLLCFHFAPSGQHSAAVMQALRWSSMSLLLGGLALLVARRRRLASAGTMH